MGEELGVGGGGAGGGGGEVGEDVSGGESGNGCGGAGLGGGGGRAFAVLLDEIGVRDPLAGGGGRGGVRGGGRGGGFF